jgi:hypothetical protein
MTSDGRGGRRARRFILPSDAGVFVRGGRWGPRRARVGECAFVLHAENFYADALRRGRPLFPGIRGVVTCQTDAAAEGFTHVLPFEVVANHLWRQGRWFFLCPACQGRASRLYVPLAGLDARCRRCWGLSYASQSWCYRPDWARTVNYVTTLHARCERRRAARQRYRERRLARCEPQRGAV